LFYFKPYSSTLAPDANESGYLTIYPCKHFARKENRKTKILHRGWALLYLLRVNSDLRWLKKWFYNCKNLKTCLAVLPYVGSIMAKAKKPNLNNDLDTSQNMAVNLAR